YGVSRLMGLHCRSSHRRPFAIPANVFGGSSNRRPRSRRLSFRSTRSCFRSVYLSQQMEYARLLEKDSHFFCVRCISKKLSLSCGKRGLDETPQSGARGGSLAAHGKRVYSICGGRGT